LLNLIHFIINLYYTFNIHIFRACIDTSEIGDLATCALLGEFSEDPLNNYDYITFSDRVSYSFNVYNNGDVLEIVSLGCKYLHFPFYQVIIK